MPGTTDRSRAEAAIEDVRQRGGVFVDAVRATRMPIALTDPNLPGNPIIFANQRLQGLERKHAQPLHVMARRHPTRGCRG